jgi:uncharacterized protein
LRDTALIGENSATAITTTNEMVTRYMDEDDLGIELASGVAAFEAKEFRRAMQLLSPLAELGLPAAQFRVAIMCQNGLGCVVDAGRAVQCMTAAAEQGEPIAQHGLGFMYAFGEAVEANGERAVFWLEQAAENGMSGSMATLAQLYADGQLIPQNEERARFWYQQAGSDPSEFIVS